MLRRDWLPVRPGRRGDAAPIVVGAMSAALVGGALWFFAPSTEPTAPASPLPTAAVPAAATQLAAVPAETEHAPPVAPSAAEPTLDERVAAHLAAGEFGAALDVALTASEPRQQADLIRMVAETQAAAGQFDAALASLRQLPKGFARDEDRQTPASDESLAGGLGADFTQLIDLIQSETGNEEYGPWIDIHGTGGSLSQFDSGVRVDPHGVLALVSQKDAAGRVAAVSARAREAAIHQDMAKTSELRMVSLTRLERAIAERLAAGKPVVESMKQLAGLSEIQYVFVYPDEGEIVIAGPAEGWRYTETGMPVGVESSRPTLQLDDLVTVLRTFAPGGANVFGCSIDPKPENLSALKDFVAASQARGPLAPGGAGRWAEQLKDKLGMQNVSVYGLPADSRAARVIVEADYRMKLIGIGKIDGGSEIPNYFDLLRQNPEQASGRIDGLRWWMTMKYDQVLHSETRTAFEIRGSSVLCQSENEFVGRQGERIHTGDAEPTNRLFAAKFTEQYQQLAQREPIFADLQNLFDLALVAALIQHDGLDRKAGWDRGVFAPGGAYLTARYPTPREVETAVNHRVFRGNEVVVQVAGGVKGDVLSVLDNSELRQASPRLAGTAGKARAAEELPAGRWWWDAR